MHQTFLAEIQNILVWFSIGRAEVAVHLFFKGPILSKMKCSGFSHDNWGVGAM